MSSLANMHQQAAIQDALLQSYRGFMFTSQSVFLAIGAGMCVAGVFSVSKSDHLFILCLLLVTLGLAIASGLMFRRVIRSRQKDVDYWQRAIIESEKLLIHDQRILTAFKIHQKMGRQGLNEDELFLKMDDPQMIQSLVQKNKGHTRRVVDHILPNLMFAAWIVFILIDAISFFK